MDKHYQNFENQNFIAKATVLSILPILQCDIEEGIFNNFKDTYNTLNKVLEKFLKIKYNVLDVQFNYYEIATLKANGYIKGKVPLWYYPNLNIYNIIQFKQ